jgi:hypothetical protein
MPYPVYMSGVDYAASEETIISVLREEKLDPASIVLTCTL